MNKLDRQALDLFRSVLDGKNPRLQDVSPRLLHHLRYKFAPIFPNLKSDESGVVRGPGLFFAKEVTPASKMTASGSIEQVMFAGDIVPRHVLKRDVVLESLAPEGYRALDGLEQELRDERTKDVLEQQSRLMEKQSATLNNTFWIYTITALLLLSQIVLAFLSNFLVAGLFPGLVAFLVVLIAGYVLLWMTSNMKGVDWNWRSWSAFYTIGMVLFAVFIGAVGYYTDSFSWQSEEQKIKLAGPLNVSLWEPRTMDGASEDLRENSTVNGSSDISVP